MRWLLLTMLFGCGAATKYTYSPSGGGAANPKPDQCTYEVLTTPPGKPFDELGVLDVNPGRGQIPESIPAFRSMATAGVCKAGGDAVIVFANGFGQYMKGTVIRYKPEAPAPAATP
ncbi:MAG: hypothetical protein IPQ07_41750 [Myxococcales bacterium]|nr:hypothetical protein [Myxococcales bacterium]